MSAELSDNDILKQATLYGFLKWCKRAGHYPGEQLIGNYLKYLKLMEKEK